MEQPRRVRLTGRAARFLHVLEDFGHLDDDQLDELLVALADMAGSDKEETVDLPLVRRVAAAILFGRGGSSEAESGALGEDWALLFS